MRHRSARVFAASCALAVLAAVAAGDIVHLKGGRRLVGRVEESPDTIRVELATGSVTLARSLVDRIEKAELPAEALAKRLDGLDAADVDGALALAADAETAGLPDVAGRALERAVAAAPEDVRVRAAAFRWRVHSRRLQPDPDGDARLLAAFGAGGRLHATAHFRIASDTAPDEVRRRAALLESTYVKVHELSAKFGIEARPIDRRLDVLLFADHARWVAALRRSPDELRGLTGLYLVEDGRIYLFDSTTLPEAREARESSDAARERLAEYDTKLDGLRASVADALRRAEAAARASDPKLREFEAAASQVRETLRLAEANADVERARIAEFDGDIAAHLARENVATTTHEACHQLTFATGICRPGQPIWLVEGLATLFEVPNRTTFVPEAPNEVRLADLRSAWGNGRASSLQAIVTDAIFTSPGADRGAAYAESWSVAHFLVRKRGEAFARYVRECRPFATTPEAAAGRLADFRRAFGDDVDAIDAEWKASVRLLR